MPSMVAAGNIIVGSECTINLPIVVAEVVGGAVAFAVDEAVFASLLRVGAVDALQV